MDLELILDIGLKKRNESRLIRNPQQPFEIPQRNSDRDQKALEKQVRWGVLEGDLQCRTQRLHVALEICTLETVTPLETKAHAAMVYTYICIYTDGIL